MIAPVSRRADQHDEKRIKRRSPKLQTKRRAPRNQKLHQSRSAAPIETLNARPESETPATERCGREYRYPTRLGASDRSTPDGYDSASAAVLSTIRRPPAAGSRSGREERRPEAQAVGGRCSVFVRLLCWMASAPVGCQRGQPFSPSPSCALCASAQLPSAARSSVLRQPRRAHSRNIHACGCSPIM